MYNITPKIRSEAEPYFSYFIKAGKERTFKKNETMFREGEKVTHLFFMVEGLVKCSHIQDGKEVILRLLTDNSAVICYSGFITNSASSEAVICLKPCRGYWISISKIESMRVEHPEIDMVFRYLAEQHYLSMERRLLMLHHKSSEQRYHYFCESMEQKIVQNTPKHCIASYLGVTPESFSRTIRKLTN